MQTVHPTVRNLPSRAPSIAGAKVPTSLPSKHLYLNAVTRLQYSGPRARFFGPKAASSME
jgi:hypothetical protein